MIRDQFIYNILMNNRSSALLSVAVDLKIFDAIKDLNVSALTISREFKFSKRGADVLLVGLTSLNLLEQVGSAGNDWYNQLYKLSSISKEYLLSESPLYLGHLISMDSKFFITPERLMSCLQSDKPLVYGSVDPWQQQEESIQDSEMVIYQVII
jgi:hypothetical protein